MEDLLSEDPGDITGAFLSLKYIGGDKVDRILGVYIEKSEDTEDDLVRVSYYAVEREGIQTRKYTLKEALEIAKKMGIY